MTFHVPQKACARRCGRQRDLPYHAYCRECRNAYMRATRPRHVDLPPEARQKLNCRAYTKVLQSRGLLERGPCEGCGHPKAQNHHHWGYDKPRWYIRFCKDCHLALERLITRQAAQPQSTMTSVEGAVAPQPVVEHNSL